MKQPVLQVSQKPKLFDNYNTDRQGRSGNSVPFSRVRKSRVTIDLIEEHGCHLWHIVKSKEREVYSSLATPPHALTFAHEPMTGSKVYCQNVLSSTFHPTEWWLLLLHFDSDSEDPAEGSAECRQDEFLWSQKDLKVLGKHAPPFMCLCPIPGPGSCRLNSVSAPPSYWWWLN